MSVKNNGMSIKVEYSLRLNRCVGTIDTFCILPTLVIMITCLLFTTYLRPVKNNGIAIKVEYS